MNLKTPMGVTTTKTTSKSRAILIERGEIVHINKRTIDGIMEDGEL